MKGAAIAIYLLGIDPIHYIVYANKKICNDTELKVWRTGMLRQYLAKVEGVKTNQIPVKAALKYMTSCVPRGKNLVS